MAQLRQAIGILPAGALGVSLFYHLTRELREVRGDVYFIARTGSTSAKLLTEQHTLRIAGNEGTREIDASELFKPDLLACARKEDLPEVLIVCPNPDQLLGVITDLVQLLERAYENGELEQLPLPTVVLSSNGIYYQRLRQIFIEKLEEATLLGRLPDLWPDIMPKIVGRFLRGVTIQTGLREGSGASAIYRPGPLGITRLAGGDHAVRERCCALLSSRGAWVELAVSSSATRLEFDKGIINLATNLLGQLYAIDEAGRFTPLRVEQILAPEREPEIRKLAAEVFAVGQAVRAYAKNDQFEEIYKPLRETLDLHRSHVPSSLQWVGLRLRTGELAGELTPTENWLLEPLIRYARSAGLDQSAAYFEDLKQRLMAKLIRAREASGSA
jgi:ketopantoate reductase